ncbi:MULTISPECIES: rod shape-determining protein MreD [Carboxydothermus]|uniref:Rod shape-determining protein MreD n=2 Tax=Carboxydothermus TaxID=129957 RepID=Q3AF77_CARHZ|nr:MULTISPECIES: rod shape-determining protein MreD [Carboxydothermus]ABB14120.1 rod shape-determining protein MreD [Carboxydothermus hydrogenoformans Z-2901]NYE57265.1 rod shape-determining protein MreD [Carboxydothermus ferrireducens DSM 11255]
MSNLKAMLYFLFFYIIAQTVFSRLAVNGVKPDLILILTVILSFLYGPPRGAFFGMQGGLIEDLFTGHFIGLNTLVKMVTGFLAGVLEGKIYPENWWFPGVIVFVLTFVKDFLYVAFLNLLGINIALTEAFGRIMPVEALYNFFLTPVFYFFFYRAVRGNKP